MSVGTWVYGLALVAGMGVAQSSCKSSSQWPTLVPLSILTVLVPLLMLFPWTLRPCHARGLAAFPFLWLGPSRLLLLCWGAGLDHFPVHASPSDSLSQRRSYRHNIRAFFCFAVLPFLPVRVTGCSSPSSLSSSSSSSASPPLSSSSSFTMNILKAASQFLAFLAILHLHARHRDRLPAWLLHGLPSLLIYLGVDLAFSALASLLSLLLDVQCQPSFHNPLMSASLSEFWSKRWNSLVSAMLRSTVYDPVLHYLDRRPGKIRPDFCSSNGGSPDHDIDQRRMMCTHDVDTPMMSEKMAKKKKKKPSLQARCLALMATFLVSGLFHELIFVCVHLNPREASGETTAFFLVHGLATMAEICLRRWTWPWMRLQLPRPLCIAFTLSFLYVSMAWLFIPPLTRVVEICPSDYFLGI